MRQVKVGDQVLFSPEDQHEVEVHGEDLIILRERDVHAVAAERIEESTGLYLLRYPGGPPASREWRSIAVGHVQAGTGGRRRAPRPSSPPSRRRDRAAARRSARRPPPSPSPTSPATTRRRSSGSRTRRTCPTRSSRSTSAVTDAELRSTASPEPAGGQRLPAARGVHDRDQRPDVGAVEPVQLGEPLPDRIQLDGQPAKEQRELLAARRLAHALRTLPTLISRRSRLSTVKGNHASPPLAPLAPPGHHRPRSGWACAGPLGSLGGRLSDVQENDSAAFLPDSAESTRVTELQRGFQTEPRAAGDPALGGRRRARPAAARRRSATASTQATAIAGTPARWPARRRRRSPRRTARRCRPFCRSTPDLGDELPRAGRRPARPSTGVDGTDGVRHRPGRIFADFADGFSGIDGLLLLAAFGVVLLILLVVYRSPILPFLVIGTAGLALTASMAVAYLLADGGWIAVNGQSQGIASILVVGAATDYGLLLVARYREELREEQSKYTAMRIALRQSWEPIVATGATVILGVLCLLFSDLGSNRGLGPISAVSVALRRPRRAHLPARRPRAARPRRVLAVPPAVRRRAPRRAAAGTGSRRSSAAGRAACWSGALVALVRRRLVRPDLRRRRHPAEPGGAGRHRVGHRPGGAGAALRRRRRQPGGHHHARGRLAGRRRGGGRRRRRRLGRPLHRVRAARGSRATRSSSTDWSGSTPPSPTRPTATRRLDTVQDLRTAVGGVDPDALVGGDDGQRPRHPRDRRPRPAR